MSCETCLNVIQRATKKSTRGLPVRCAIALQNAAKALGVPQKAPSAFCCKHKRRLWRANRKITREQTVGPKSSCPLWRKSAQAGPLFTEHQGTPKTAKQMAWKQRSFSCTQLSFRILGKKKSHLPSQRAHFINCRLRLSFKEPPPLVRCYDNGTGGVASRTHHRSIAQGGQFTPFGSTPAFPRPHNHCSVLQCYWRSPTAMTWWVIFCGLDWYGWDMSNKSRSFDPTRRLGDKCKAHLAEPSTEPFWSNSHLPKNRRRLWDQCKELFGEHCKKPFGRRKPFAAKNPRRQTCHFAPRPLLWLKTKKMLTLLGKNANAVRDLGDLLKEVMEEPWTLVKPRWTLVNLPSTEPVKTEPFGSPKQICPEKQRHHEIWTTLLKPWCTLGTRRTAPEDLEEWGNLGGTF